MSTEGLHPIHEVVAWDWAREVIYVDDVEFSFLPEDVKPERRQLVVVTEFFCECVYFESFLEV